MAYIEIGRGKCKFCGNPGIWARRRTGKPVMLDQGAIEAGPGTLLIDRHLAVIPWEEAPNPPQWAYQQHWCQQGYDHFRKRRSQPAHQEADQQNNDNND